MFRLMGKEESDMKNFIVKNGPGFLVCLVIAAIAQGIARLAPAGGRCAVRHRAGDCVRQHVFK